jgi:CBS domain-containing protein
MATSAAPRQPTALGHFLIHGTGERHMRAHQIMTRSVATVAPDATILDAANLMLRQHVSGLPVVDAAGKLVGIVSISFAAAK